MATTRSNSKVQDILVKAGLIDDMQRRSALARLANWGGRLTRVVVDMGFTTDELITEALASALRMPVTHLGTVPRDANALSRLSMKYCEQHAVFPISLRDRSMQLAMADPTELDVIDEVQSKANARVTPLLASDQEILAAISRHYKGKEYKVVDRGARRFTDEAVPAAADPVDELASGLTAGDTAGTGVMSRAMRTEETFELDSSAPPKPGGAPGQTGSTFLNRPPSANTMLDEMIGEGERTDLGFTQAELVRLEAARHNQEKTGTILRALKALLAEKGLLE